MRAGIIALLLLGTVHAQDRPSVPTMASFGLRAADTAQTCRLFAVDPTAHEAQLPGVGRSCTRLAGVNMGIATLAWAGDRWLTRRGHPRWGHALQWFSAAGAVQGISFTSTHWRKP